METLTSKVGYDLEKELRIQVSSPLEGEDEGEGTQSVPPLKKFLLWHTNPSHTGFTLTLISPLEGERTSMLTFLFANRL
ncbi:MAG: hypothetical protein HW384_1204 [Dehalococcoidia bacterium]|nr:hypothetical protein [Dehalococcoidia bacterium]